MYKARKKSVGAQKGNTNAEKQLDQNDPIVSKPRSTAEALARELGIIRKKRFYSAAIISEGNYTIKA